MSTEPPCMKQLSELMSAVPGARLLPSDSGAGGAAVSGLAYDSRRVSPGDLFFCIRGAKSDGHRFLPEVAGKGASAAVVEDETAARPVPALLVPNVREAMPALSTAFFEHPSRKLSLVGVTGTNGKTTTTYLIQSLV